MTLSTHPPFLTRRCLLGLACGAILGCADRRSAPCVSGDNIAGHALGGDAFGGASLVDRDLSSNPVGPVLLDGSGVLSPNCDLAIECAFSPTSAMWLQQETSPVICLCDVTTDAGSLALQYEAGRWLIRLGGIAQFEVLDPDDGAGGTYRNDLSQTGLAGDSMRVVFGYMPSVDLLFLQISNNGCATFLATNRGGPSGAIPVAARALAPLGSISSVMVGSRIDGTLPLGARWGRFRALDPASLSGTTPEAILVVGDSTDSALSFSPGFTACAATPSHIYTPAEAAALDVPRIRNQAIGGATIVTQTETFVANLSLYRNVQCVITAPGVNDARQSSSTMIADYQTLVNTIKSSLVGVKVIARLVTPCLGSLGSAEWALVVALNAALQNDAITGIDYVATTHYTLMSDRSGNLLRAFDSGDGLHPNDLGRAIVGGAYRGGLAALGFL
jgi:hypothetical protein